MKTQKKDQKTGKDSMPAKKGTKEMKQEDMKKVKGGSGLLSGGNDITNIVKGAGSISNSTSGSDGSDSYTSTDKHNVDLGLGNALNNMNF